MCRLMEEMTKKAELNKARENALTMLADGELPIEKIAIYSGLSIDEVKALAEQN